MQPDWESDLFISHASEDKETVARPLALELRRRGVRVWFDEFALRLGDSLRREIDRGLRTCRYGLVILSPDFFQKEWPQRELDALTARQVGERAKVILPVWHNVGEPQVRAYSPALADTLGVSTAKGLQVVVDQIMAVLTVAGIVTQRPAPQMRSDLQELLDMAVEKVRAAERQHADDVTVESWKSTVLRFLARSHGWPIRPTVGSQTSIGSERSRSVRLKAVEELEREGLITLSAGLSNDSTMDITERGIEEFANRALNAPQ